MPQLSGLFAFALWLCAATTTHAAVLAVVGDKKITTQEFKKKYDEIKKQTINPPAPRVFLEDVIRYEMGVQQAYKQKIQNDPIVKERFRQELYKALIEKAIGDKVQKIKVTEREMKAYYRKNPELRTSHILIEFKPDATEKQRQEAKKRALEIYKEVKKSKRPFKDLVKLYTDDTMSKSSQGDIGFQSRMTLVPSYYDAALKMKMGAIKGPVRTRYGYHIIKLTGRRSYEESNKRQLRAAVFDEKRKVIFDQYFVNLKNKYKIKITDSELKKIQ